MKKIIAVWLVITMIIGGMMGAVTSAIAETCENKNQNLNEKGNIEPTSVPTIEERPSHDDYLFRDKEANDRDRLLREHEKYFQKQERYNHLRDKFSDEAFPHHLHHDSPYLDEDFPYQEGFDNLRHPYPHPFDDEYYLHHEFDKDILTKRGASRSEFTPAPAHKDLSKYTSHNPIYIDSNAGFNTTNGVSAGDGSANNPYIIENWDINASTANGIEIRNTDKYFIIRNCVIHDGKSNSKYGIYFYNVQNGKMDNVTSYNNDYGIYLYSSSNNNITNCSVYNNYYGIGLYSSSNNNQITNCYVYNNYYYGIYLSSSNNNQITNSNIYINKRIGISFEASSNNTVIKCDIYKNTQDYWHIEWNKGWGVYCGGSSNNNTISECNIYRNSYDYGYGIYQSNGNIITKCNIWGHTINIYAGSNNQITNCELSNSSHGISIGANNTVGNCDITNNYYNGLSIGHTSNNTIMHCNISSNGDHGIYMASYSSNNSVTNCNIYSNGKENGNSGVYIDSHSSNNSITNSNLWDNFVNGISICNSTTLIHNNTIIGNADYAISSDARADARFNFFGTSNTDQIAELIEGDVDHSNWLEYSPTEMNIQYIDISTLWENTIISTDKCIIVNSNLTLKNTTLMFNSSIGQNFIQVNGNLTIVGSTITSYGKKDYMVLYLSHTSGIISQTSIEKQKAIISHTSDIVLDRVNIYNGSRGIIFIGKNYILKNCNISKNNVGILLYRSSNITITGNIISDNYNNIELFSSTNNIITNQDIYHNINFNPYGGWGWAVPSYGYGVYLRYSSSNNTILNCSLSNLYAGIAQYYEFGNNNTIINCLSCNNGVGIALSSSSNSKIVNFIHYTTRSYEYTYNNGAIDLHESSNNQIINCIAHDTGYGVRMGYSCSNNEINNCLFYNNIRGMWFYQSLNNNITNCTIYNNSRGFQIEGSSNNNITNSVFYNNTYGIQIYSIGGMWWSSPAINNRIYHNNFVNNTNHACDSTSNFWNSSYPAGGNYWDNYTGIDLYSGVGQNISGNDGIGDTPYNISGTIPPNKDRYPLMNPVINAGAQLLIPLIISISISATSLMSGDNSTVNVHITDGVYPVSNATVTLTSNNGGSFSPHTGITNNNGDFTSNFIAPSVTTQTICRITAEVTKPGYISGSKYVDVTVGPVIGLTVYYWEGNALFSVTDESIQTSLGIPGDGILKGYIIIQNNADEDVDIEVTSSSWIKTYLPSSGHISSSATLEVDFVLDVRDPTQTNGEITIETSNGWSKTVPIRVDSSIAIVSTNFDVTKDGYNFVNPGGWLGWAHCYGMSVTSILYYEKKLSTPYGKRTYDLSWNEANGDVLNYHLSQLFLKEGDSYNIEEVYGNILAGHPVVMNLFFGTGDWFAKHMVVGYKYIDTGDKIYVQIYDPNCPYDPSGTYNDRSVSIFDTYAWATYTVSTGTFSYINGGYSFYKFFAFKPETNLIADILGGVGSIAGAFVSIFSCPINVTIYDDYGGQIGYDDGEFRNTISGADFAVSGDVKIYYLPLNRTYNLSVEGNDTGTYNCALILFAAQLTKIISILDVDTSKDSIDYIRVNGSFDNVIIHSINTEKNYSVEMTHKINASSYIFRLDIMAIKKGATHRYDITKWDALNDTTVNSVKLTIDENSDGTPEHTVDLHTGMTGEDVENIIEGGGLPEGEEAGGLIGKISELPWLYIIIPVVIIIVLAVAAIGVKRRKKKAAPPSQ